MMNDKPEYNRPLDESPEAPEGHSVSSTSKTTPKPKLTLREKLESLNELLVDACIDNLQNNKIKPNDLGAIVTLLKNNKVIEEKREHSESDLIDSLIRK